MFAQDRWRVNDRLMFELGMRVDRDDVVEKVNYLAAGRRCRSACCRRDAPSCAAASASSRSARRSTSARSRSCRCATVSRFGADGQPLAPPVTYAHAIVGLAHP